MVRQQRRREASAEVSFRGIEDGLVHGRALRFVHRDDVRDGERRLQSTARGCCLGKFSMGPDRTLETYVVEATGAGG